MTRNPTTMVLVVFAVLLIMRLGADGRLKAMWETAFASGKEASK